MPRIPQLVISACALIVMPAAHGACNYPDSVKVPDGSRASTEEMVDGQTRIKQYMAEMEAYLKCLDQEEQELGRAPTTEELQVHNQKHNAAVDAMEAVAADFNEQVRAFKKNNP